MLTAAAALVLLLVGLLAIPVGLEFRVTWNETFEDDVRLRWAFGLVRVRIPLTGARNRAGGEPASEPSARTGARTGGRAFLRAARDRALRQRIGRFLGDLWRAARKRDLRLRVRIGLGDPADTGRLWSVLGPLDGMLASLPQLTVEVEPDFVDSTLSLNANGSVEIVPLRLACLGAALLVSPSVWRGLRLLRATG